MYFKETGADRILVNKMKREEIDKHLIFLKEYAAKNGIVFKVTQKGVTVEEVGKIDL